jgi:hypothetical protein
MTHLLNSRRALSAILGIVAAGVLVACDGPTEPLRPGTVKPASLMQQTAVVNQVVAEPPAVRVTTAAGRPVPGVTVTFRVVSGGGSIPAMTAQTNADGVAAAGEWRLGTTAGDNVVAATVDGLPDAPVTFRATALAGPPAWLQLTTQPPTYAARGTALFPPPTVQLMDEFGNAAPVSGVVVTAGVVEGAPELRNTVTTTSTSGIATFAGLTIMDGPGSYRLTFNAPGLLGTISAASITVGAEAPGSCSPSRPLNFVLGETVRVPLSGPLGYNCLEFDIGRNQGEQYLLLLENMPDTGAFGSALFPGPFSPSTFSYTVHSVPRGHGVAPALAVTQQPYLLRPSAPARATHSWDFGAGPIYEIEPVEPPGGVPAPQVLRPDGMLLDINTTVPAIGDTLQVRMEGIPRLGIPSGDQKAVIRFISNDLIIAEDVRLTTSLPREGGGFNTPLHPDTMQAIADQYAAIARVQGDMLFEGRHNSAVEGTNGGRTVAIHSVMYANNIWGYTYSQTNYFVWDYWVGTDGSAGGVNQHVQRNVDNLFMHEIAHMRHVGLLQRSDVPVSLRGNRWLVEGFARFSERLPIAARLLGTQDPSRTSNIVLPRNPAFGTGYFMDDVPTYLNTSTSMVDGYQHSSYVFDYLADQVALQGGDWRAALRDFLIAAGDQQTLDAAVNRTVGLTFGELFTRARLALYLDDIGTPGLPPWTQYHQFQLRASRPAAGVGASNEPRTAWTRLVPGSAHQANGSIPAGAAWGFLIDGTQATSSTLFNIIGPYAANAVLSVTRVR